MNEGRQNMNLTPLAIMLLSASLCRATEPNDFAGTWSNVDEKSSGITRIDVATVGKTWKIRAWGAVDGGEKGQGETTLSLLGDYVYCARCVQSPTPATVELLKRLPGEMPKAASRVPDMNYGFAHWDFKFMDSYLTLRREKDNLIAEEFNIFKDDSERTNYRVRYLFRKAK
jgi:hypothetical protein